MDADLLFHALAHRTRRRLLDRLRRRGAMTAHDLGRGLAGTRQSVGKHLAILEAADLVVTRRFGREKLHFLNVVPIHGIASRWIRRFDRPRLRALDALRRAVESRAGSRDADAADAPARAPRR
jgi:DNA-binding transcriptional ArsR family regulator